MDKASVLVKGLKDVVIPVTSSDKPRVPEETFDKWQHIVDLLAKIANVPVGLIMQVCQHEIGVFVSSKTDNNPYKKGDTEHLGKGLYCETVVGSDHRLLVPDAREDPLWQDNPDIPLGMYSYLGFPLKWPDGDFFGTICLLDNKKNEFDSKLSDLMHHFKQVVESDLKQIINTQILQELNVEKEMLIREIHHQFKNNLNFLLLTIQLKTNLDMNQKDALESLENRIFALSEFHNIVCSNEENLVLDAYIKQLVDFSLNTKTDKTIRHVLDIDHIELSLKEVNYTGLMINELMTNSFKHAFKNVESPEIRIAIKGNKQHYIIQYFDNGPGISEVDFRNSYRQGSVGVNTISLLVECLKGKYQIDNQNGFLFTVSI